ncbi:Sterile alpha motif domain [Dillenia turbinata]|uniref:Sterile alpha motif domain n=1 Tax=Dillenia turbinata TaxID=194707 RepID=A0AAN8UY65_9MAGN
MLVLSMNSKRQRRPNVRLGQIGDFSAAFACGSSQRSGDNLLQKGLSWKHEFVNTEYDCGFSAEGSSRFAVSDPEVSPKIAVDLRQNRENKNPNSLKSGSELASSNEVDVIKPKLNFGNVTRKCRRMRRRARNARDFGVWNSKQSPEINTEDGKDCGRKELVGFTLNSYSDLCNFNSFMDSKVSEMSATVEEASDDYMADPAVDVHQYENLNEYSRDGDYYGGDAYTNFDGCCDKMGSEGSDVNLVTAWLEEQGFGKYSGLFEMHEVDEEALMLLTFEDLKEMGVLALGPRRKLYSAIQQLRERQASHASLLSGTRKSTRVLNGD